MNGRTNYQKAQEQGRGTCAVIHKSQNALLPFQGSRVMTSVLSTMNGRSRVEVILITIIAAS